MLVPRAGISRKRRFLRIKNRKPTQFVWPQCSPTNRRVRTGRILSNYKVTVGFSLSASRAMTSELELDKKYTGREMSRAHLGWMIYPSRGNIVLWLSLSTLPSKECLETNRVTEFSIRSLLLSSLVLRDTRGERYLVRSKVYETEGAIFRSLRSEVSPLTTRSALLCHRTT